MLPIAILPYEPVYEVACAQIIAALPDWFGIPESNAAYLRDLGRLPAWVATADDRVVGAAILRKHYPGSFEIHFMAVHPDFHLQGVGRRLVERLEVEARNQGGRWLHVKTLAPSHPDPFYARTRAFYTALGFSPLFETGAIWGSDNPAVIMVKILE